MKLPGERERSGFLRTRARRQGGSHAPRHRDKQPSGAGSEAGARRARVAGLVVVRPNGSVLELNPRSGTDFAFDAPGDTWESHAIERTSPYLPAGRYRVKVQAGVVAGATSLRLDDWTLAVERVRP